jgi:hypothetical protein
MRFDDRVDVRSSESHSSAETDVWNELVLHLLAEPFLADVEDVRSLGRGVEALGRAELAPR